MPVGFCFIFYSFFICLSCYSLYCTKLQYQIKNFTVFFLLPLELLILIWYSIAVFSVGWNIFCFLFFFIPDLWMFCSSIVVLFPKIRQATNDVHRFFDKSGFYFLSGVNTVGFLINIYVRRLWGDNTSWFLFYLLLQFYLFSWMLCCMYIYYRRTMNIMDLEKSLESVFEQKEEYNTMEITKNFSDSKLYQKIKKRKEFLLFLFFPNGIGISGFNMV